MFDWPTMWRDFQERPILQPLFRQYNNFMNIKRHDSFPFYVSPYAKDLSSFEDTVVGFLDHLVDAHELERNKCDQNKNFYQRTNYVARNFHRYSNDTMANLMFDTQLRKTDYDRLNSVMGQQTLKFYGAATALHLLIFSYACFFFRMRTLNRPQVLAAGTVAYFGFTQLNDILYKVIVDRKIMLEASRLGHDSYVQPNGTQRPRGLNFD